MREGFKISRTPRSYLGDGVYFFDDQFEEALAWANRWHSDRPPVAVIQASIRYGKCLNLYNKTFFDGYRKFSNMLRTHAERHRRALPSDATVINALASATGADSVKAGYKVR